MHWRRYSCTGSQALQMQRAREMNAALYNGYGDGLGGGPNEDDDHNGPKWPVQPEPIKPLSSV